MSAVIIDGKAIAAECRAAVAEKVKIMKEERGYVPGLAVIIVGDNPASQVYVRNKRKACDEVGFYSETIALPGDTTEEELLAEVKRLADDDKIHGILVQLPLPKHLDEQKIIDSIPPEKDVDCFTPHNTGLLYIGRPYMMPCTPAGIIRLLDHEGIDIEGKNCVVIGRSNIVGKPMGALLLSRNGTVTICHSRTPDLKSVTQTADILVSAVGKAGFVTADMVKEGAVVIDVGMNRNAEGKLCGDVCYTEVAEKASAITPVPGGVGPMTIAMLMENALRAAE